MAWEFFDAIGRVKQAVYGPPVPMDTVHVVGAAGEPAFQNSWVAFDAPRAPRFRKYPDGKVQLAGAAKTGANGTVLFTLPVGYRPPATESFAVPSPVSGGVGIITIASTGTVTGDAVSSTIAYLDGIEFDTESVLQMAGAPAGTAPLVTALPTNPVDGQECMYLADATNGVLWHLRYRAASASAYKWEFCGGAPLNGQVEGSLATTSLPSTYSTPADALGPNIALPLAGDYDVDMGCTLLVPAGGGQAIYMSYAIGATAAVDADSVWAQFHDQNARPWITVARSKRQTVTPAGTLAAKYRQTNTNQPSGDIQKRWMRATPVRVG